MGPVTQPCGWGVENGNGIFKYTNSVYLMILRAKLEAQANSTQNNQENIGIQLYMFFQNEKKKKKTSCWDPREYFFSSLSFLKFFIDSKAIQGYLIFSTSSLFISYH